MRPRRSDRFFAHLFSLSGAVLTGLAFGSLNFATLQPYSAIFLLSAILLYVWSSHFWARRRQEQLEQELAFLRSQIAPR